MSARTRYRREHDSLTKFPNRNFFHKLLQREIDSAPRKNRSLLLCILGLDRFREINHTFGLQNGDLLLKDVAQRFTVATKRCAARARLGNEEFAALFSGIAVDRVETLCADILGVLETPFLTRDIPIDLSGTIGVALFPEHGEKAELLLQRANIALDMARYFSRSFVVYNPTEDPYNQQKLAYLGGIRNAIEQNQLVLHFQPKVDMKSKRTRGFEALVRWSHPQIGLVPPHEFIHIAERTGLIHALSRWVLRHALEQCRLWRGAGLDIPIAVNLSPRNFHDRQLPDYIGGLLRESRLPADLLELEITETMMMTDVVPVTDALNRLSRIGIRTYIDDFGTGYSSLGHLKKLPVAGIKIDKSFVNQMTLDENDAVIVRSTIDLGHNLGIEVVAEGVESPEIWDRLSLLGCDTAQGYYVSHPKPASELERWIAESPWGIGRTKKTRATRNFRAVKPGAPESSSR